MKLLLERGKKVKLLYTLEIPMQSIFHKDQGNTNNILCKIM